MIIHKGTLASRINNFFSLLFFQMLDRLPIEIIYEIISFLGPIDLNFLGRVNKTYYKMFEDFFTAYSYLHKICKPGYRPSGNAYEIVMPIRYANEYSNAANVATQQFTALLSKTSFFKTLSNVGFTHFLLFTKANVKCKLGLRICEGNCRIEDILCNLNYLSTAKLARAEICHFHDCKEMLSALSANVNLKSLKFLFLPDMKSEVLKLIKNSPNLQELRIDDMRSGFDIIDSICQRKSPKTIKVLMFDRLMFEGSGSLESFYRNLALLIGLENFIAKDIKLFDISANEMRLVKELEKNLRFEMPNCFQFQKTFDISKDFVIAKGCISAIYEFRTYHRIDLSLNYIEYVKRLSIELNYENYDDFVQLLENSSIEMLNVCICLPRSINRAFCFPKTLRYLSICTYGSVSDIGNNLFNDNSFRNCKNLETVEIEDHKTSYLVNLPKALSAPNIKLKSLKLSSNLHDVFDSFFGNYRPLDVPSKVEVLLRSVDSAILKSIKTALSCKAHIRFDSINNRRFAAEFIEFFDWMKESDLVLSFDMKERIRCETKAQANIFNKQLYDLKEAGIFLDSKYLGRKGFTILI